MLAKNPTPNAQNVLPIRNLDKQLEDLYARRSAVDSLIQSLEDYERFRARRFDVRKRKTA
jgi:hypothetical protein